MPLELKDPKPGRTPYYRVRGTYLGQYVDRTTETSERKVAIKLLNAWKTEIERGAYSRPDDPTFASAAIAYINAGGSKRFIKPLATYFQNTLLAHIGQAEIDAAAVALYPDATVMTRNRQVYTPVSAILKRGGVKTPVMRPKGWRGKPRLHWLTEDEAFAFLTAAQANNARFGALCTFLLYTGVRLSEATRLAPGDIELNRAYAFCRQTKNGEPQAVHLPPVVVAALAELDLGKTVFPFKNTWRLYQRFEKVANAAGVTIPEGIGFHIFRHTYAAMMRRLGADLSYVGRWKDPASIRVYEHVDVHEEAKKADFLPVRRAK
jgi:integrase